MLGTRVAATALALSAAGCIGSISTDSTPPSAGAQDVAHAPAGAPAPSPTSGPSAAGTPASGAGSPATACQAGTATGYSLRRLTRFEYVRTVQALLGTTVDLSEHLPDDVLEGRGFDNFPSVQNVTDLHAERWDDSARQLAAAAVANLPALLGCDPATAGDDCATGFLQRFARRAYRRPLQADEQAHLLDFFRAQKASLGTTRDAVEVAVTGILESPSFLYRVEIGDPSAPLTSYELATRLSYLLIGSMPDDTLARAADQDMVKTPQQVRAQAERLLADPRARDVIVHLFDQWLDTQELEQVEKDPKVFPRFSRALLPLWRQETAAFVDEAVRGGDGRLDTLLGAPFTFVNRALAQFYGVPAPATDAFTKVALPPDRVGLLGQSTFLATHAHINQTSPVKRGVFVRRKLLCQDLAPPPQNVDIKIPEPRPGLTTRQRFESHTMQPLCSACHVLIDRVGVGLEKLDGIGLLRDTEEGMPIDVHGELNATDVDGPFEGLPGLAARLSSSDQVRACVVRNVFEFAYARTAGDADGCLLQTLGAALRGTGTYRVRDLLLGVTGTPAFLGRTTVASN